MIPLVKKAWGRNNYGQLGTSIPNDYSTPQKIIGHSSFKTVQGGHWHTIALKSNGTVWSWGHNFYGELGNGCREHSNYPTQVIKENGEKLSNIIDIVSVGYHSLALDRNGNVYSWGGGKGELSFRVEKLQPYAKKIDSLNSITNIAVGWQDSVALNEKGKVFIWGSDPSTQNKESTGKFLKEITQLQALPKIKKLHAEVGTLWQLMKMTKFGDGVKITLECWVQDTLSYSIPQKLPLPKGICNIGGGCQH